MQIKCFATQTKSILEYEIEKHWTPSKNSLLQLRNAMSRGGSYELAHVWGILSPWSRAHCRVFFYSRHNIYFINIIYFPRAR